MPEVYILFSQIEPRSTYSVRIKRPTRFASLTQKASVLIDPIGTFGGITVTVAITVSIACKQILEYSVVARKSCIRVYNGHVARNPQRGANTL